MGQGGGEIDRVLAGAAADLEHSLTVGKNLAQHRENGRAVLLAGFGVGLVVQVREAEV
jgi:hypothetical protein